MQDREHSPCPGTDSALTGHTSTFSLSFPSQPPVRCACFYFLLHAYYPRTRPLCHHPRFPVHHTHIRLIPRIPISGSSRSGPSWGPAPLLFSFLLLVLPASQREPMGADWVAFKFPPSLHNPMYFHTLFAPLAAFFMLAYNFDSESGSDIFLLNVDLLSQDYTAP